MGLSTIGGIPVDPLALPQCIPPYNVGSLGAPIRIAGQLAKCRRVKFPTGREADKPVSP